MDKETCQKLYQEYQELKKKTNAEVYTKESTKNYHTQNIKVSNMMKLNKARKQLKTCLDFFTDEEIEKFLKNI